MRQAAGQNAASQVHNLHAAWLRVYLSYAPGVGKTDAMVEEGRRRRDRGTDVVVGWVATYDRPHTIAAVGDLARSWLRGLLGHSMVREVLQQTKDVDVHIVRRAEW